jgi:hypothetical protein
MITIGEYLRDRNDQIRKAYHEQIKVCKKEVVFIRLSREYRVSIGSLPRIVFTTETPTRKSAILGSSVNPSIS